MYLATRCFNCSKQPLASLVFPLQIGAKVLYSFSCLFMSNKGALHSQVVQRIELYFSPPHWMLCFCLVPNSYRPCYSTQVHTTKVGIATAFPKLTLRSGMRALTIAPRTANKPILLDHTLRVPRRGSGPVRIIRIWIRNEIRPRAECREKHVVPCQLIEDIDIEADHLAEHESRKPIRAQMLAGSDACVSLALVGMACTLICFFIGCAGA